MGSKFNQYASDYDAWFLENENVLYSEVKLVAHFLDNAGEAFSVGCGSGLFETILDKEFSISIKNGIEPSEGMAAIAKERGLNVEIATAEEIELGKENFDTILFNGTPSYITDLQKAVKKAIEICDHLAANTSIEKRKKMWNAFVKASKMEWMFWDSAYKKET